MPEIPWGTILKNAPAILAAAETLLVKARQRSATSETASDITALRKRVAELDEQQRASAELVRQLADQVNAMTLAVEQGASRLRIAYAIAIAGVVLGIVACLTALLR